MLTGDATSERLELSKSLHNDRQVLENTSNICDGGQRQNVCDINYLEPCKQLLIPDHCPRVLQYPAVTNWKL